MATKPRSPNYPACSLQKALDYARKIYSTNHLHKAPREVVAKAMGYGSLNGGSLTALSALKKYGLVEEDGSGLKITEDALTALVEPPNSPNRARTLVKLATKPELFAELQAAYPGPIPGDEILRSWLLRKGFLQNTVELPIRAYRETMELAEAQKALYTPPVVAEATPPQAPDESAELPKPAQKPPSYEALLDQEIPYQPPPGEREWLRGALSRSVSYKVLITGEIGPKEIGKLIKLLEAQKLVLDDDADEQLA